MKDIHQIAADSRDILDCINSGVYVTDTERRIVFWNRAAEAITGYSRDDVVGQPCYANILRHRDKDGRPLCATDLCPLHRSMQLRAASDHPVVIYARSKDGDSIPVSTSTGPIYDDAGNVIGGVEVFRDERDSLKQMELARTVQRQMLTQQMPRDERVSFEVQFAPSELISGDFYHVRPLADGLYCMFLADAAGHGTSAALSTSLIYSLIMECAETLHDPGLTMAAVNDRASQRATGLGFFTAVAVVVDTGASRATFCAAGHPPLLLQRADGGVEQLGLNNLPVGVMQGAEFETREIEFGPGQRLLAYTDGAPDVETGGGARLGVNGLAELLAAHPPAGSHGLTALFAAILDRCVTVEPGDDVTLLSCLRS
jgi:sigma-B regulation protein RsbU (phosphoserine phosphatase)